MRLVAILIASAVVFISLNLAEGRSETRTTQVKVSATKKKCSATYKGIRFYRSKTWTNQDLLDVSRTKKSSKKVWRYGCDYAEWVRKQWKERNEITKKKVQFRTLSDPGDWGNAIHVAQRAFPGTADWLWSCSGAEGGHGRWVPYGDYGDSYYPGYEKLDAVGGWMQFRPSTIQHAWPTTYSWLVRHRWIVKPRSWFDAWFSPLAQALSAAYYLEIEGSAGHHWSASSKTGC